MHGNGIKIFEKEEEYLKECLLENGRITSMRVPWEFEELKSILERNARTAAEKRFKRTKLAAEVEASEKKLEDSAESVKGKPALEEENVDNVGEIVFPELLRKRRIESAPASQEPAQKKSRIQD